MTITARKYALFSGIKPGPRKMAGLFVMELAVLLSWTVLMETILELLSGSWLILLPVSYLFAVTLLALMERQDTGRRENNPLEALGLGEISLDGSRPSEWQTLRRLALTPPLILLFCAGLVRVNSRGNTLLQVISGTRIVPLDESMDPRPDDEIFRVRKRALNKVIAYTMVSFMMAAVITFVPPQLSRRTVEGRITAVHSLPERERELLADYLEMKALYPDCLEVRVRLASLYYRNDMREDMQIELAYIRRRDPDHAILLLEQDNSVNMEDLIISRDSTFADSIQLIPVLPDTPAESDTSLQDTIPLQNDSVAYPQPSVTIGDTLPDQPDTLVQVMPDTTPVTVPPEDTATVPEDSGGITSSEQQDELAPEVEGATVEDTLPVTDGGTDMEEPPSQTDPGSTETDAGDDAGQTGTTSGPAPTEGT